MQHSLSKKNQMTETYTWAIYIILNIFCIQVLKKIMTPEMCPLWCRD